MTLKRDAKFKEELTCGFKYDMRNLVDFHPTTQKYENFILMDFFCPNCMRFELKKYRDLIFHDTEWWCKIWMNPDFVVSNMAWEIGWNFIRALKSLKNCTVMGSFFSKACNLSAIKFQGNFVLWHSRVMQKLTYGSKNDIRNLVNFNVSSSKYGTLHFDVLFLSIGYKASAEKVQKNFFSWQWKVIQILKKKWLFLKK